jgi:hypothetical protein
MGNEGHGGRNPYSLISQKKETGVAGWWISTRDESEGEK